MTRDDLLARVRQDRIDALAQAWFGAILGVLMALGAGFYGRRHGFGPGATLALTAGGSMLLVALTRLMTPKPGYAGGRLEARATVAGVLVAVAFLATFVTALAYALSEPSLWRRGELLAALVFVAVLMVIKWGVALGPAPIVIVDAEGYHDRRATRSPIPWSELEPIDVRWVRNHAYYRVRPRDLSRLTWPARLNMLVGFPGFALNGVGLDHGEGDMLLAIHAHRPDLVASI
jgi:hypothetical protein